MPKKELSDEFPLPQEAVLGFLQNVVEQNGWKLKSAGRDHYRVGFGFAPVSFSKSVKLEIWLSESNGSTRIRYKGSQSGLLMGGVVRDQVVGLRDAVASSIKETLQMEVLVSQVSQLQDASKSGDTASPEEALKQLQRLREQGLLDQEEYETKRKEILARL